jgi:deazaflavin-dependent oxidoreductase (nitroreductase family)
VRPEDLPFCYLTTTGRVSGRPHTIEIWFALHGATVYLLSGGRSSDWLRNLVADPRVTVRIGELDLPALARVVTDVEEEALARRLLPDKYATGYSGDLTEWGRTAVPVALDLEGGTLHGDG